MSIVAYTGLPGAGKSYGVVENVILPAFESGREVWTNIPLQADAIRQKYPEARFEIFDVASMVDSPAWCVDTVPPGVVFVLDEVWRVWPAGLKANQTAGEYKTFLAEHRHRVGADGYSTEIVLVTQDLSQLSNFARELVETTYIAHKHSAMGADKRYRVDIYQGAIKGQNGPKQKRISQIHGKYKPQVYAMYQSHTQSSTGAAGSEAKSDKRASVWRNPFIRYGVPFSLLALCYLIYMITQLFNPQSDSNLLGHSVNGGEQSEQTASSGNSTPKRQASKRPRRPVHPENDEWRLGGVMETESGEGGRAFLVGTNGRARIIGLQNCDRFGDTGEWYCELPSGRVTSWSAPSTIGRTKQDNDALSSLTPAS